MVSTGIYHSLGICCKLPLHCSGLNVHKLLQDNILIISNYTYIKNNLHELKQYIKKLIYHPWYYSHVFVDCYLSFLSCTGYCYKI